jgi:hypothetical protein
MVYDSAVLPSSTSSLPTMATLRQSFAKIGLICRSSMVANDGLRRSRCLMQQSEGRKKPYSPPCLTKLTLEQARQFAADHAQCSDQEAGDLVESLRRERPQKASEEMS